MYAPRKDVAGGFLSRPTEGGWYSLLRRRLARTTALASSVTSTASPPSQQNPATRSTRYTLHSLVFEDKFSHKILNCLVYTKLSYGKADHRHVEQVGDLDTAVQSVVLHAVTPSLYCRGFLLPAELGLSGWRIPLSGAGLTLALTASATVTPTVQYFALVCYLPLYNES